MPSIYARLVLGTSHSIVHVQRSVRVLPRKLNYSWQWQDVDDDGGRVCDRVSTVLIDERLRNVCVNWAKCVVLGRWVCVHPTSSSASPKCLVCRVSGCSVRLVGRVCARSWSTLWYLDVFVGCAVYLVRSWCSLLFARKRVPDAAALANAVVFKLIHKAGAN